VLTAISIAAGVAACRTPSSPSVDRSQWPHEPPGLSTLTDRVWTELTGGQWDRRDPGTDRIVQDSNVQDTTDAVLEYVYPAGFAGGRAPATQFYPLHQVRELFVGLQWKVSDPWQGHATHVNKIHFMYTGSADVAMVMHGPPGGPYEVRVLPQWPAHTGGWLRPNVTAAPLTLGVWHRIEWYLKYESQPGAADGIIRWWIDDALAGDYAQVRFPEDAGFVEYQISPTWGGVGDTKTETDYYRFHRSYISGR